MKKIFNHIITFLSLITFLCLAFLGTFLFFTLKDVKLPVFTSPSDIKYSKILDENDNIVSSFYSLSQEYVAYKDLRSYLSKIMNTSIIMALIQKELLLLLFRI